MRLHNAKKWEARGTFEERIRKGIARIGQVYGIRKRRLNKDWRKNVIV